MIKKYLPLLLTSFLYAQENKTALNSVYVIGNTVASTQSSPAFEALSARAKATTPMATVLVIGNAGWALSQDHPKATGGQDPLAMFKGDCKVYILSDASSWDKGLQSVKAQQDYVSAVLHKKAFQPQDGCPIQKIEINDQLDVLLLDSQWALMDWNGIPNLNDDCDIRSKSAFYTEVESQLVKSQDKIVLVACYHPVITYGKYGGTMSFGLNPQETANRYYRDYSDRMLTLGQRFKNVVFLGGHGSGLQYILDHEIPIIVCGSTVGGRTSKGPGTLFNSGEAGFTQLTSYSDGSLTLAFYGESNGFAAPVYQQELVTAEQALPKTDYKEYDSPEFVYKSIYEPGELEHSGVFTAVWGKHYREDYITPVKIRTALLDTLYGGLTVLRKGGGHQTNSLRVKDKNGKEYSMRNAKKSALRFIQYFLFKTQYLSPDLNDTFFIQLLQDYWTTANPYGSLTIGELADAIAVYHANPELYYLPKQKALGEFNDDYGDKVYFIEEQIGKELGSVRSFGYHNTIIGTDDLVEKLQRKDKVAINEALYIRSRLFDNILGDFDRHSDQWRWAEDRLEDGTSLYSPIPRDRDQAFSDFDGPLLGILTTLSPPLRFMQRYNGRYKALRWFNDAGDDLDRLVLRNDTEQDWAREARFIREHLSDSIIDIAFSKFPEGINTEKKERIRNALKARIDLIETHSHDLYSYVKSFVMVTGTEKDDWFEIVRQPGGKTSIRGYRIKEGQKTTLFWDAVYDSRITKEIWVYGLEGKDIFEVSGEGNRPIKIKLIGGRNNDVYSITDTRRVHLYDQRSKPNTFSKAAPKTLTDNYETVNYNFMRGRRDVYQTLPAIAYNPDDGAALGATFTYTKNDLVRNPFTAQHSISGLFYTATQGVRFEYHGEFACILRNLNLGINAGYTTPNFTDNFFGYGNTTVNDNESMDYNRVRMRNRWVEPSLIYRGYYGSLFQLGIRYENIKVENTQDRVIASAGLNPYVFEGQDIYTVESHYSYGNFDSSAFPEKGLSLSLTTGYKANFSENKGFVYLIPELRLTTKLDRKGVLTYATQVRAQHNFNNQFEFYQAASLGDGQGLRGFRKERFSGKTSYYQDSDLRLSLGRIKNRVVPLTFGIYGGFDYGRVWLDGENSQKWHTSQGGGLFFTIAGLTTANIAYFTSQDGGRLNIRARLAF